MSEDGLGQPGDTEENNTGQAEGQNDGTSVQKKRKAAGLSTVISQKTISKPDWSYVHIRVIDTTKGLVNSSNASNSLTPVDQLTVYMHVQSALKSFLGLHGTAIAYDFVKTEGQDVWLRVSRHDAKAFVAAVGGWIDPSGKEAMRVMNWGCWAPREGRNGMDLFGD